MSTRKHLAKTLFILCAWIAGSALARSSAPQAASLAPMQAQASLQSLDELGLVAEQYLAEKTKNLAGKAEIAITPMDARLRLPACQKLVPYQSQGAKIWGKTTVAIRCEAPENWRIMVRAHVRIHTAWPVAASVLPQGHVIRESDLAMVTGDITAMPFGILTGKEQALGRTVVRSMQPGAPIRAEQLRAPKAIQQGQSVRIVSQGNGFMVSGEGYAINSAGEGQVAKAKMPNGAIVRGIARTDGIIEVSF